MPRKSLPAPLAGMALARFANSARSYAIQLHIPAVLLFIGQSVPVVIISASVNVRKARPSMESRRYCHCRSSEQWDGIQ
jgi:hypothetical protein